MSFFCEDFFWIFVFYVLVALRGDDDEDFGHGGGVRDEGIIAEILVRRKCVISRLTVV